MPPFPHLPQAKKPTRAKVKPRQWVLFPTVTNEKTPISPLKKIGLQPKCTP
ncbi:predicted protein [Plenodomus lingam JN3]|uniref:Predicted protein n=1 Tax=Leptosphaeria maculans (strain JN3 / isolate v23.1.3 / race Av1-4-5-6-7-8) TaxID=985895 RepID=E5R593_LEPMJ|nr:predicted protein [Plenodomus lingam JN3]CBX92063.1 predicted protein [Plenodomus lingam JN3]